MSKNLWEIHPDPTLRAQKSVLPHLYSVKKMQNVKDKNWMRTEIGAGLNKSNENIQITVIGFFF